MSRDDGWEYSTEGDLDPDLAEGGTPRDPFELWDRPRPNVLGAVWRVLALLIIAGLLLTLVQPLL